jgi:hypothetical protein
VSWVAMLRAHTRLFTRAQCLTFPHRPLLQSWRPICAAATKPVGPDPNDLSNVGAVLRGTLPAKYKAHGAMRDPVTPPPLVIFCGWMGAKSSQMDKYLSLWHARGADTYSFAVGPMHVLFPSRGMAVMEAVTAGVREELERGGERPIIFHHMSVGGYLFGQWLRALERDGRSSDNDTLLRSITAQIFDSPPDVNGIANGAARSMCDERYPNPDTQSHASSTPRRDAALNSALWLTHSSNPTRGRGIGGVRELVFALALRLYLALTHSTSGVHHRAASDAFHANTIRAPALWFYSRSDEVARHQDCARVAGRWLTSGIDVTQVVWENTPHIQHFRVDPERYVSELDSFLERTRALAASSK